MERETNRAVRVDAHAHVWQRGMPLVPGAWLKLDYDFTPEQYLQALDEHAIDFGFLAAASPFGDYNDYTIAALRRSPRLRGSAIVDPAVDMYVLERMHADGVRGIRLQFFGSATVPDLGSFAYRKLFRRVRDLAWHVHLCIDGPRLPQVLSTLEQAGVNLVVDHFGMPDPKAGTACAGFQALLRTLENGRTWVKVSAGYRFGDALAADCGRMLIDRVGGERLMWASDCPFAGHEGQFTYQQTIDAVEAWVPAGVLRDQVFGLTALKLLFS